MRLAAKQSLTFSVASRVQVRQPIDSLRIGEPRVSSASRHVYDVPDHVFVSGYDHRSGRILSLPVTRIVMDRQSPCVSIRTARGREVEMGGDARLAVFDAATGDLAGIRSCDAVGRWMPSIRREPVPSERLLGHFDRDLGWLYGAMVADGWCGEYRIGYAKNDPVRRQEVIRLVSKVLATPTSVTEHFSEPSEKKFGNSAKVHINGRAVVDALLEIHALPYEQREGRSALYKKIPDELLSFGSRECLLGLFSGLLDGDASVGWNCSTRKPRPFCRLNTSSQYLVSGLLQLGRFLGVRMSVTDVSARKKSKASYIVSPSVVDLKRISHELTPVSEKVQAWLADFALYPVDKDDIDVVPVSAAAANVASAPLLANQERTLYAAMRKAAKSGALGRRSARRIVALLDGPLQGQEAWEAFKRIVVQDDVHWDRVKSVSPAPSQDVFSLVAPGAASVMLENGLVVYAAAESEVAVAERISEPARRTVAERRVA